MPHRPTPPDEPRRRSRRRDEAKRPTAEPHSFGEEGRYSSDQARYYGADTRSFDAFGAHRPSETRPDWRRGRYESGRDSAPDAPFDEDELGRLPLLDAPAFFPRRLLDRMLPAQGEDAHRQEDRRSQRAQAQTAHVGAGLRR